jgi:MFS family permease
MGTLVGALFCVAGSALQAGSVNANMFICARVISGIGIGFTSTIIPPWIAELSQAHARGATFSYVFIANFVGITIAVWLNFGIRNTELQFRWRFPLGIMVLPMLVVAGVVLLLPESPRWLMSQGRREESIEILRRIRGDASEDDPQLLEEIEQLQAVVEASHHKRNDFINLIRGRYSGKLHLGRRVVLSLALQQISSWTGIIAIVTRSGELFRLSGFSPYKSSWLGGLVNTTGIFGTAAAALVIDRLGRKMSWLVAHHSGHFPLPGCWSHQSFTRPRLDRSRHIPTVGNCGGCFVFIFLWFFTMFGIIPVWVYGTEIWPLEVRAKGYAFTVLGWAIGCGMTTLTIPIMLSKLGW